MIDLQKLVRTNIRELISFVDIKAEEPVRDFQHIMLDVNENPYNKPFNRYPSDNQTEIKEELAKLKGVTPKEIFLSNGSTEAIDMCYRIFCQPKVDNVIAIEPTCELYKRYAILNDIEYRTVLLDDDFQLNATALLNVCDKHTKLIWLCSPNSPSGNLLNVEEIEKVLKGFDGIVVIDEAYSDFSRLQTFRERLSEFPNMIVLNTFSKAWASAAIRLGVVYAQEAIINIFNKVSSPYHISQSNANFFLAKMKDAQSVYDYLCEKGINVKNCSNVSLCDNCLRITIGSKAENAEILGILRYYKTTK